MKKYLKRIIGLLLFLLIILFLLANRLGYFSNDDSRPDLISSSFSDILPVQVVVIEPRPLTDKLVAAGTILPDEQVEISAETSGRITNIHFEEGSYINQNELLVTVNNTDLLAQLERNSHQLQLAEAREKRQKSLLERQGISQQAYDQVYAELSILKAEEALLQAQLEKTLIRAPFDGHLGLRHVSEGAYISPGMKIVSLAKTQPVKIEFSVPERYAPYLDVGNTITFAVDNQGGALEARIFAIEPVVDLSNRSIVVRAIYPNSNEKVIPGSFARVELLIQSLDHALQIPAQALIPEMGSNKVYVYRNGNASPVDVNTGLRTESHIQIVNGLHAGDTVITTGILQMRPGLPVTIQAYLPL